MKDPSGWNLQPLAQPCSRQRGLLHLLHLPSQLEVQEAVRSFAAAFSCQLLTLLCCGSLRDVEEPATPEEQGRPHLHQRRLRVLPHPPRHQTPPLPPPPPPPPAAVHSSLLPVSG